LLFLFAAVVGLGVPHFAVPRLALSTHLLGISQGIFLVVIGLLWPKLSLGLTPSRFLFWLLIYGCVAALAANFLGAAWGAGNSILTLAAGSAHGSELQEGVITILLRSAGTALIAALILILWGLRSPELGATKN
jgi:hydroxylaminobenzene mutase